MKAFPAEKKFAKVTLASLLTYFAVFFIFSSLQTIFSMSDAGKKKMANIDSISYSATEMAVGIPVENRDAWLLAFRENPDLLILCAENCDKQANVFAKAPFIVGETLPLSLLF